MLTVVEPEMSIHKHRGMHWSFVKHHKRPPRWIPYCNSQCPDACPSGIPVLKKKLHQLIQLHPNSAVRSLCPETSSSMTLPLWFSVLSLVVWSNNQSRNWHAVNANSHKITTSPAHLPKKMCTTQTDKQELGSLPRIVAQEVAKLCMPENWYHSFRTNFYMHIQTLLCFAKCSSNQTSAWLLFNVLSCIWLNSGTMSWS